MRQYRYAIGWIGAWLEDIHLHVLTIEVHRFGVHAKWRRLGRRGRCAQQEGDQQRKAEHASGKGSGGVRGFLSVSVVAKPTIAA
jgi:hypothetical protein